MKNFKKKAILGIGSLAAITAPIASTISCGDGGISRYDARNDGKLVIASTFAASGVQTKALETIIKKYNSWLKENPGKKKEGYMPLAELATVSGGYGAATQALRKKFSAKDKDSLQNLIIDYPSSSAIMKSYAMQLNLKDVLSKKDATALEDRFEKEFFSQNEQIGGLDHNGIWAVPISVSSSANAINSPLFAYVLNEIKRVYPKAINKDKSTKIEEIISKGGKSTGDIETIKKLWGTLKIVNDSKFQDAEISDDIFTEWDTLLKFGIKAQKGFGKGPKSTLHLFAFDSPTNLVQMLSYAYSDGNMDDFYINIDKDGYVDFEFLKDKKSNAYKNFIKGVKLLKDSVDSGALWIGGKGAYGSSELIYHRSMMSIGSTAGASHWYTSGDTEYEWMTKKKDGEKIDGIKFESMTKDAIDDIDNSYKNILTPAGEKEYKKLAYGKYGNGLKSDESKYGITPSNGVTEDEIANKIKNDKYEILIKVPELKDGKKDPVSEYSSKFDSYKLGDDSNNNLYYLIKLKDEVKLDDLQSTDGTDEVGKLYIEGKIGDSKKSLVYKGYKKIVENSWGKHGNKFYKLSNKKNASKYDIILVDKYTSENLSDDIKDGFNVLVSVSKSDVVKFEKNSVVKGLFKKIGTKYNKVDDKIDDGTNYYLLKGKDHIVKLTNDDSIQESEVAAIAPPNKVKGKKNGGVYVQGPSLIPVHSNAAEDKALGLFIMWMTDQQNKYVWKDEDDNKNITDKKITVLEYWLAKANYIAPLKGAFKNSSEIHEEILAGFKGKNKKYWMGTKIAWDIFNKANSNENIKPIIQPVDDFTSLARNEVTDPVIKGIYTRAHVDGKSNSLDEIYDDLRQYAKRKKIV